MRIAAQGQTIEVVTTTSSVIPNSAGNEEVSTTTIASQSVAQPQGKKLPATTDEQEISKEKIQNAVDTINEFLHINHNASKFVLHDGLDRYFVQVVDTQTEEVVKEIPPKKLLDAFYEMQKLLGMIVDEKI